MLKYKHLVLFFERGKGHKILYFYGRGEGQVCKWVKEGLNLLIEFGKLADFPPG